MDKSHDTNLSLPGSVCLTDNVGGLGEPLQPVGFRAVCRKEPLAFLHDSLQVEESDVQQTLREGRGALGISPRSWVNGINGQRGLL